VTYLKPKSFIAPSVVSSTLLTLCSPAALANIQSYHETRLANELAISAPQLKTLSNAQLMALAQNSVNINRIDARTLNNQVWVHQHLNLPGGKVKTKAAALKLKQQLFGNGSGKVDRRDSSSRYHSHRLSYGVGMSSGDLKLKVNYRF